MTTPDNRWWPTTWGALRPDDLVQGPDGRAWTIGPQIRSEGTGHHFLVDGGRHAWTSQLDVTPVMADRPPPPRPGTDDPQAVVGALRLAGFDVEVIG
jgi:hypothetical protein